VHLDIDSDPCADLGTELVAAAEPATWHRRQALDESRNDDHITPCTQRRRDVRAPFSQRFTHDGAARRRVLDHTRADATAAPEQAPSDRGHRSGAQP
jgi:hypothetical protein